MARAVLINPPRLIDPKQRVKYGAVASITRMAELAFDDMKALAMSITKKADPGSYEDPDARMRAISLAWSIVDQADLLRHLIGTEKERIQLAEADAFLAEAAPIKKVRDWMRHLPQRVDVYLARSEPLPPALGALSFCFVKAARVDLTVTDDVADEDVLEYHTIVLLSTAFERNPILKGEPDKYVRFNIPVDHFFLQAFGYNINLKRVVASMTKCCDSLSEAVSRFVNVEVQKLRSDGKYITGMEGPAFEPGDTYTMVAKRES